MKKFLPVFIVIIIYFTPDDTDKMMLRRQNR